VPYSPPPLSWKLRPRASSPSKLCILGNPPKILGSCERADGTPPALGRTAHCKLQWDAMSAAATSDVGFIFPNLSPIGQLRSRRTHARFRRTAHCKIQWDTSPRAEDFPFWVRFANLGRAGFVLLLQQALDLARCYGRKNPAWGPGGDTTFDIGCFIAYYCTAVQQNLEWTGAYCMHVSPRLDSRACRKSLPPALT
jgi:hypothetical protein